MCSSRIALKDKNVYFPYCCTAWELFDGREKAPNMSALTNIAVLVKPRQACPYHFSGVPFLMVIDQHKKVNYVDLVNNNKTRTFLQNIPISSVQ